MTEITLEGLKLQHFPVSVFPRQVNEMLGGNPELLYMGRNRWHLPTARVMTPSQECHLVVSNRTESWISKSAFKFRGGKVMVPLTPATRLTIHWHTDPQHIGEIAKGSGAIVSLKTKDGTYWRFLQAKLIEANGRSLPTLVGRIIVPRGRVELECSTPSGKQAWKRIVEANKPFQTVEVEND